MTRDQKGNVLYAAPACDENFVSNYIKISRMILDLSCV